MPALQPNRTTATGLLIAAAILLAPIAPAQTPTASLGPVTRSIPLTGMDYSHARYKNGYILSFDDRGHLRLRGADGHLISDLILQPTQGAAPVTSSSMHDADVLKDGSIVASWIYTLPHNTLPYDGNNRHFFLVHYDQAGNFIEQLDLGRWRALRVCVAPDQSVWTLSAEEWYGHAVYTPDEGVLRNYTFAKGLVRAVVPRSNFPHDTVDAYASGNSALDCSGDKIRALTNDAQWIEYTPGANFTLTPIASTGGPSSKPPFELDSFASLRNGRAYAILRGMPGNSLWRSLAELLPSPDGKSLTWIEIPPTALPANNPPTQPAIAPIPPPPAPKDPVTVTSLLGVDDETGESLIYQTSTDPSALFSKPIFTNQ